MQQGPSNEDRLRDSGLIDPDKALTPEQEAAIEDLTTEEVDQLIEVNSKLGAGIPLVQEDPILEMPGRNPNNESSQT